MDKKEQYQTWFNIISDIKEELSKRQVEEEIQRKIIQRLKHQVLKELDIRGNMLNMHEKHIPRIKKIYEQVLLEYFKEQ